MIKDGMMVVTAVINREMNKTLSTEAKKDFFRDLMYSELYKLMKDQNGIEFKEVSNDVNDLNAPYQVSYEVRVKQIEELKQAKKDLIEFLKIFESTYDPIYLSGCELSEKEEEYLEYICESCSGECLCRDCIEARRDYNALNS
jgi:hypothetical protein